MSVDFNQYTCPINVADGHECSAIEKEIHASMQEAFSKVILKGQNTKIALNQIRMAGSSIINKYEKEGALISGKSVFKVSESPERFKLDVKLKLALLH